MPATVRSAAIVGIDAVPACPELVEGSTWGVGRFLSVSADRGRVLRMTAREVLQSRREEILRIAAAHGARDVRVFGSVVRREDTASSDVDFLVKLEPGRTLLDLVGLKQALEDALRRKVDVLTEGGISPYIRDRIHAESVPL